MYHIEVPIEITVEKIEVVMLVMTMASWLVPFKNITFLSFQSTKIIQKSA